MSSSETSLAIFFGLFEELSELCFFSTDVYYFISGMFFYKPLKSKMSDSTNVREGFLLG